MGTMTLSGPLVRLEHELSAQLSSLLREGTDAFLIVSAGGYYVQFIADPGAAEVYMEAVSNHYLPPPQQIPADRAALLADWGFGISDGNYARTFVVDREMGFGDLVALSFRVFREVYGLDLTQEFSFQLDG
jgi:hypothetical protein